ncbi:unnamed protein product [Cylicocyclus nassatus]|uniref:Uncharacterized protein n=1 Tax=Cylicocyclus nassatus TaxID=53992 RepID=A0AA36MFU8_CYLNA|nr:unnamed protein product [Cylicocyclus nassatus]
MAGDDLRQKIKAANESAETFRIVLRITVGLLIFTLVFTLLMFLHYKRTISLWPSLHPYHVILPKKTTTVPTTPEFEAD